MLELESATQQKLVRVICDARQELRTIFKDLILRDLITDIQSIAKLKDLIDKLEKYEVLK